MKKRIRAARDGRVTCVCRMRIHPSQQKFHDRSVWHSRWETIEKCLVIKMSASEIARMVGVSPSHIAQCMKRMES